jgi:hypothetical protein
VSNGFKRLLLVVGGLSLLATICAVGIVAWVDHAGTVVIRVHETGPGGSDVAIRVPAALVRAVIAFSPSVCVGCATEPVRHWKPLIETVCRTIRESEDFTLVESADGGETVHIAKEGTTLVVKVVDSDEQVHISVPFHLVSALTAKI